MESKIYVKKSSSKNGQSNYNNGPSKPKMKIVSGESHKDRDSQKPPSRNARVEPHLHLLQKYSNYNWDGLDINDLYNDFKEIEKNLKNLLDNDYKQSTHVVSDFASLREHFVLIWEKILFMDINYACAKEIDKRLWFIIKKPIESLNKEKKKDRDTEEKLVKAIDSNITMIKEIIQKISSKLDIQNTPITEDNAIRKIASNLMSYLGELFQIREKATAANPTFNDSVGLYFRSSSLYPYEGKYFMLISNCSKLNKDLFGAVYWGMRAYCCTNFYPMNEQLLKYLEEARLAYLEMLEREWLDVRNAELFKYFILSFLRYLNIILTKIGFEELNGVTSKMFEYLQKYISYLISSDSDPKVLKTTEGSLVQQTVMLMIYSLYNSVQGYDPRNDIKEKYLEVQGKSFAALASNDLAKETLRYSYGIIFHLLDLLMTINDDNYLSTFSPLLYYLVEHKSVADYLFSAYKQLKDKFISFNKRLNEWYKKKCEALPITNEEVEEILEDNAFTTDKLLFGFVPLIPYFINRKTCHKKLITPEKQHVARMRDIMDMLDDLNCRFVDKSDLKAETKEDILSLEGFPSLGEEAKSHTAAFGDMLRNKENKEKNLIVLDGQNVAIRYGDTRFASKGLKLAIDFWVERGHQVYVMLPDYYFKKEEVAMKRQLAESKGESLKHIPDDVDLLVDLKTKGYAYSIPNWNYDDSYIIDYAKKKNAYIVTNDRYNDHIEKYSKNDQNLKKKLRDWVRNNCISFTFIGEDFMPNPDFLNEHMK